MKILRGDLWGRPEFMKVWTAQTISEFGARFTAVGLPLAAILVLHADPRQAGLLAALATAPRVVIGLLAGGYIDRSRRRRTMILSDLARAALLATVPAAALFHLLTLLQLYVVTFLIACASVVFDIANQAYFPALVDAKHLAEGNTKLSVTASLANVGGPAVTGFLIQLLSAPLAVGVTTLSYLGSAAFLVRVHDEEQPPPPKADRWLQDFREGFASVWRDRYMRPVCLMDASSSFFVSTFAALYPFIAFRELHLSPFLFGATFAAGGVGALGGAAIRPWLTGRFGIGPAALIATVVAGSATLAIPLTYAPPLIAALILAAAQFTGDAMATIAGITVNTLRQGLFRADRLGRITSVFQVSGGLTAMLGGLAGGLAGQALGPRPATLIAACGLIASTGFALFSPLRSIRDTPEPPTHGDI
jgi:MFS family permease